MRTQSHRRLALLDLENAPRKIRLFIAALAFANLIVPAVLSNFDYSPAQLVLAMLLLDVCLYPSVRYLLRKDGLPILPVLCLAFAVQYSLPIFTQDPGLPIASGFHYLEDADIVASLALSIIGIVTLQISYYSLNYRKAVRLLPHVSLQLNPRRMEVYCIVILVMSVFLGRLPALLSDQMALQFSAPIGLLQNQLLVVIGLLSWLVFTHQAKRRHTILLYVVVGISAIKGFSTTMMESMMVPLAVLFMSKWFYSKRLPVSMIAIIAALFLFLSPVKKNIRSMQVETGITAAEVSTADRATDWVSRSLGYWGEALSGQRDFVESTSDASSRTDLIHTFAHIYSLTPTVVPYQYGDSYSYLAIAWIPRVIWPEKPQANAANNFFAVAYEVSTEEGVKTSSFGATLIGEGYMNFGVPGVIIVMCFLGLITSLLEDLFAGKESGPGGRAIFLATFVYFLNGIGSSAELMFGGIVQNMAASVLLLWWVRAKPTKAPQQTATSLVPAPSYRSLTS